MDKTSASERARRERDHFDHLSELQGEVWWGHLAPAGRARSQRRAQMVVRRANIQPGHHVLEIGCGAGFFTRDLIDLVPPAANVKAIDISPAQILNAQQSPELSAHSNLTFEVQNIEDLSYPDETFHAIVGSSILHHIDIDRTLPELRRVMKPEGMFVFAEPNASNPIILLGQKFRIGHGIRQASADEKPFSRFSGARQLARHGFTAVSIRPFDFLHPATPRFLHGIVSAIGRGCEALPLVREIAGSLLIAARKPPGAGAQPPPEPGA